MTKKKPKQETPTIGHNSDKGQGIAGDRIKSYIERIERLQEEKKNIVEDISEIYMEIKSVGLEPKIVRKIIKIRKMDVQKRREENELLECYASAIGMQLHFDF